MRTRRSIPVLVLLTLIALAGCGLRAHSADATVLREPVSTANNPFSDPVGTDQSNVTPPPNSGGTFPGDTVGLFGGSEKQGTCDKTKMIAFLQQDKAKAAAFASVLGISVSDIPGFIGSLTPAVLRSDTRVTNHGFANGKATEIPAVLQAGTAVFVDVHGAPVIKCFCGNPLTPPAVFNKITFTGPQWTNFTVNQITVIAPVTQNVQQFVMVEPGTNKSFQRPVGSTGAQDQPAATPPPTVFPRPPSAVPPPTPGGTGTSGGAPPPGIISPSATASPSPSLTSLPSPTSPGASPSTSGAVPPPAPSPTASPTASPTGSPSPSGSPSPTSTPLRASWSVGDCFVQNGRAHATVLVRPDGTTPHTFNVTVRLGPDDKPLVVDTVKVAAQPGQVGQGKLDDPSATPDGRVQCAVLSIVDENGVAPVAGDPLPPPTDSTPMPAQPQPGASGPMSTPPPLVTPGASPT